MQIAKELGAHVTGVCSTPNVEMARALGAVGARGDRQDDGEDGGQP